MLTSPTPPLGPGGSAACLCQSPQDFPRGHSLSRMLCILLTAIKAEGHLGAREPEITPFQVHSWLQCWGSWVFWREGAGLFGSSPWTQPEACRCHPTGRPLSQGLDDKKHGYALVGREVQGRAETRGLTMAVGRVPRGTEAQRSKVAGGPG